MSKDGEHKSEAQEVFEKALSSENLAAALIGSIGKDGAEDILSEAVGRGSRRQKTPREPYNIQFAQGISTGDLITLLQYELLRARTSDTEVMLPTSIVHDIKFRLGFYLKKHGEVERPPPKRARKRS